jgi:NAD(P)H-flavin reductase
LYRYTTVGDTLDFQGPKGRYEYRGRGVFAIKRLKSQGGGFEIRKAKNIGMIAGGTGITPMLQIMRAAFRDAGDKSQMRRGCVQVDFSWPIALESAWFQPLEPMQWSPGFKVCAFTNSTCAATLSLIFANQTEGDILLRDELEACEADHENFKMHYTVDRPPAKWDYSTGFISAEVGLCKFNPVDPLLTLEAFPSLLTVRAATCILRSVWGPTNLRRLTPIAWKAHGFNLQPLSLWSENLGSNFAFSNATWGRYAEMIQKHMPPPGKDTQILLCGPPPMVGSLYSCWIQLTHNRSVTTVL